MSAESLGAFVRRIRTEKNMSCQDVSKRSARKGKRIAGSYVNRIENDPDLSPSADRLKALADGLGVPVDEVFARAVGVTPLSERDSDEVLFLTKFRKLSRRRQRDVVMLIDALHAQERT